MSSAKQEPLDDWLQAVGSIACQQSYAKLFKAVSGRVYAFLLKQQNDPSMAGEVLQETMLKVWQKAALYDASKGTAITWIYSVARNTRYDYLRRNKHQSQWFSADDIWSQIEPEKDGIDEQFEPIVAEQMSHLIDKLPELQSDVVRRVYLHGQAQQEVADEVGVPLGTVKSRLRLGLRRLREMLDEEM
ncbi:sigma-70 family RNA polymerase sigma factor [Alginatibacterium sediminis]|nr:sigma-70 family RNA polymerase sigma factor [Alginatibacterium sediminis]